MPPPIVATGAASDSSRPAKEEDAPSAVLRPMKDVALKSTTPKDILQQCDALIGSDSVDKDTSIRILKLYGALESINAQLQHEKAFDTETLRNEINILKLSQSHAVGLEPLRERLTECESRLDALTKVVETAQKQVTDATTSLHQRLETLESRVLAITPRKR